MSKGSCANYKCRWGRLVDTHLPLPLPLQVAQGIAHKTCVSPTTSNYLSSPHNHHNNNRPHQVKLTAEPKKQALELLRTKIETQNTKVVAVRQRHDAAKKVSSRLSAAGTLYPGAAKSSRGGSCCCCEVCPTSVTHTNSLIDALGTATTTHLHHTHKRTPPHPNRTHTNPSKGV